MIVKISLGYLVYGIYLSSAAGVFNFDQASFNRLDAVFNLVSSLFLLFRVVYRSQFQDKYEVSK